MIGPRDELRAKPHEGSPPGDERQALNAKMPPKKFTLEKHRLSVGGARIGTAFDLQCLIV
jgi:hypothetical protein